jgi:hypothetical protein
MALWLTGGNGVVSSTLSPALRQLLERVSSFEKLVLVKAIAGRAMDRLRNLAGRAFGEAFVIRKKPGGNDDR